MKNLMEVATEEIRQTVRDAFARLVKAGEFPNVSIPEFVIEVPAERTHGDFSANIAMAGARTLKMAPRKSAELLLNSLQFENTYLEHAEVAGPGFLNFFLASSWLYLLHISEPTRL